MAKYTALPPHLRQRMQPPPSLPAAPSNVGSSSLWDQPAQPQWGQTHFDDSPTTLPLAQPKALSTTLPMHHMVTNPPSTSQSADNSVIQQLVARNQREREQHQQELGQHQQEREQLQQNNKLSLSVVTVYRKWTLYHLARLAMQKANRQGPLTKADATALVNNAVNQMQQMVFANPSCPAPVEDYGPTTGDVLWATNALFNGGRLPSLW